MLYDLRMTGNGAPVERKGVSEVEMYKLTHDNDAVNEIVWKLGHGAPRYTYDAYDLNGNRLHITAKPAG